ncbi:unnamed protein product [Penicillium manginii]
MEGRGGSDYCYNRYASRDPRTHQPQPPAPPLALALILFCPGVQPFSPPESTSSSSNDVTPPAPPPLGASVSDF